MSDGFMLYLDDDGVARHYDDTYDITIHCESEEEQQKAIEQLKSLQWIPCSGQLPTKKTEVIYTLDNHYVCTGYMTDRDYNGDEMELHWEDIESGALIYPEALMPLPEPYAERRTDET